MPSDSSFDVVSQIDRQEMVNAVDQVTREVTTLTPSASIEQAAHVTKSPNVRSVASLR